MDERLEIRHKVLVEGVSKREILRQKKIHWQTLEKILRAGSNAKHTSLRKTDKNRFDVDLGAYYSGRGATKERLSSLLEFTRDCLIDIYYQKNKDDFKIMESAVRVQFISGYFDLATPFFQPRLSTR